MIRFPSREVFIGNRPLGGRNPIRLQSMTNTSTLDIRETVRQTIRIFEAGADYIRISVPNRQSALNLEKIRKELRQAGFDHPIIADIHFNPELALIAARLVEKVRINPGNYNGPGRKGQNEWSDSENESELLEIQKNITPVLEVCKQNGTAIRIGTNFGSLSPRIIARYGNTPEGMVQSTIEFLKIFEGQGFYNTVISLKASNPLIMIRSYLLMVDRMLAEGMNYPLHLGVTEAGEGENGRIKSALGISTLLQSGIGDTIRVSLSEAPEAEIPVARKIAKPFQDVFTRPSDLSAPFHLEPFDWLGQDLPDLPGALKALLIQKAPENERAGIQYFPVLREEVFTTDPKSQPDLVFLEERTTQNDTEGPKVPQGKIIEVNSGAVFSLKNEKEILSADFQPHSRFNFIYLSRSPQGVLLEKLKTLPGLVILWGPSENHFPDISRALLKPLKSANIAASVIPRCIDDQPDAEDFMLQVTADFGRLFLERKIHGLWIENPGLSLETAAQTCYGLMQATGLRITKTEFISCPTCGRTSFDLLKVLKEVKAKASHLPGIKIAVMGCVVNGPGEMADADYGIMGAGINRVHIYRGNEPILKNIPENQAADALLDLITKLNLSKLK